MKRMKKTKFEISNEKCDILLFLFFDENMTFIVENERRNRLQPPCR